VKTIGNMENGKTKNSENDRKYGKWKDALERERFILEIMK
jgi:hypothetical protein